MERMSAARHCRHCTGDCQYTCLIGDDGRCLHGWDHKPPWSRFSWQMVLTRKWWRRVFWGNV